jgi:hypothetical protein
MMKLRKKEQELEGIRVEKQDDIYTLLECHVNLDLEGFEDKDPQTGEPTGIKLPYVVTIEESSREVLSIRRNYKSDDPLKIKTNYFVHFKFLPGLRFLWIWFNSYDWWFIKNCNFSFKTVIRCRTL